MNDLNYKRIEKRKNYSLYNRYDSDHVFNFKYEKPKKTFNKFIIILSLVPIFIVLLTLFGHINKYNNTTSQIYNKYYTPITPDISRGVIEISPIESISLNNFYKENNISKLQILLGDKKLNDDPVFNFYMAMSLQEKHNYKHAIKHYKKVIKNSDNLYVEEAKWYMALCYLKNNDINKTKYNLLDLIYTDSYYSNKSKEILKLLDSK